MPDLAPLFEGFTLPDDAEGYRAFSAEDLTKIIAMAVEAAKPHRGKSPADLTDEDVDTYRMLAEVATNAREAQAFHAQRESTRADDLAAADAAFATEDQAADADKPADKPEPKAKPAAPGVADVAKAAGRQGDKVVESTGFDLRAVVVAAPNAPGLPPGSEINDFTDIGRAIERSMRGYGGGDRPASARAQTGVAVFKRAFPEELSQKHDGDDEALIEFAATESRLPGGSVADSAMAQIKGGKSLTAAAGWCAPSQTVYDLFELEAATGMIDVPEIQITRGGLRFTPGPDFGAILGGTGYFHKTEAEVIADSVKPCMVVPCPSFTDVRLEVEGVCITGAILMQRGYPEAVARFTRGAMVVHRHKLNAWVIAAMVAGSTAVDFTPYVAASAAFDDTSATTGLLATLEMAVVDYRYKHKMPETAVLEAVFPIWTLAVLRADLSRRTGVQLQKITDEFLMSEMRLRGVRPQFVYDWQDVFSGLATGPGDQTTPLAQFPTALKFMLYAPGTWVRGSADVITLDTIYDSVQLATNIFTALFTEEGVLVAKRGHDSRVYEVPFCPTGATSATNAINCT